MKKITAQAFMLSDDTIKDMTNDFAGKFQFSIRECKNALDNARLVKIGHLNKQGSKEQFDIFDNIPVHLCNGYISGPSGSGKSTLIDLLAADRLLKGDNVIILDLCMGNPHIPHHLPVAHSMLVDIGASYLKFGLRMENLDITPELENRCAIFDFSGYYENYDAFRPGNHIRPLVVFNEIVSRVITYLSDLNRYINDNGRRTFIFIDEGDKLLSYSSSADLAIRRLYTESKKINTGVFITTYHTNFSLEKYIQYDIIFNNSSLFFGLEDWNWITTQAGRPAKRIVLVGRESLTGKDIIAFNFEKDFINESAKNKLRKILKK